MSSELETNQLDQENLSTKNCDSNPVALSGDEKLRSGIVVGTKDVFSEPMLPCGFEEVYSDDSLAKKIRIAGNIGKGYQVDLIMRIIHDYTLRGKAVEDIARDTDLPIPMVVKYKRNLHKYYRKQAEKIDLYPYLGKTNKVLDDLLQQSIEIAENNTVHISDKLRAIVTAKRIEDSRLKVLETVGVFDGVNFSGDKRPNSGIEAAEALKGMAEALMKTASRDDTIKDIYEVDSVEEAEFTEND